MTNKNTANSDAIEIQRIQGRHKERLAAFFRVLAEDCDAMFFDPHPLTDAVAHQLADYSGDDLYYVIVNGNEILAYGMLRGWDEGYEVPSLGIAVHPSARGKGLAGMFMQFLQAASWYRGARRVRVTVYPANKRALALCEKIGYQFQGEQDNKIVGYLELTP